jgi:hypothetical protein
VATDPPPDLTLVPLGGRPRTVQELLVTFHMLLVAFDPYEEQSSWLLETATRLLRTFEQADVRVAVLVTADAPDARLWLGPHAQEFRVFVDPDRTVVKSFGLKELPAAIFLAMDGTIVQSAEGWHPAEWRKVVDQVAQMTGWKAPTVPLPKDPAPFAGSPV